MHEHMGVSVFLVFSVVFFLLFVYLSYSSLLVCFCFILLFLLYYYPLEARLLSNETEMGWIWMEGRGEELGGVEGWEIVIRIYYI